MVKFSVFTKAWPALELSELADLAVSMGFDGVELPVRPGFQVSPETAEAGLGWAVKEFEARGLCIFSVAGPLDANLIRACGQHGVSILRVPAEVERGKYLESEERLRTALREASTVAAESSVKLGIQPHYGDNVTDAMGARHLVEQLDPRTVGVIWDAGHDGLTGQQPESSLDIIAEFLIMVNLKNAFYVRGTSSDAPWARHFTTGRNGLASWRRVGDELNRRRYDGVVCLSSQYTEIDETDRFVEEDLAYAREVFAATIR